MKKQPTPETDAAEKDMSGNGITVHTKFVTADFARKLERERDEAARNTEKAKAYKKVMKDENARLRQGKESVIRAASDVVERWETPLWKDAPATATFIHRLRDALSSASASRLASADPETPNP